MDITKNEESINGSSISIEQQITNAITWLDALLSGKWLQGYDVLETSNHGIGEPEYCCWGVLCKLMGKAYEPDETSWDIEVYEQIGLNDKMGYIAPSVWKNDMNYDQLMTLNDAARLTFPEIAAYLIQNARTNFIPEVAEGIVSHYANSFPEVNTINQ